MSTNKARLFSHNTKPQTSQPYFSLICCAKPDCLINSVCHAKLRKMGKLDKTFLGSACYAKPKAQVMYNLLFSITSYVSWKASWLEREAEILYGNLVSK